MPEISSSTELVPLPDEGRVATITKEINFSDPSLTISYGTKAMQDIAGFSDSVLQSVRAKDAGPIGEQLTDLMLKVKSVDLDTINKKPGFLESLPIIGSLFNQTRKTIAQFDTLLGQVETVSAKLDQTSLDLLRDIEMLEQLFEKNYDFHKELSNYIEAGKIRLEEARNHDLPRIKAEAEKEGDGMAAQKVKDFAEALNRFERRLHDLQLSRAITLQTAPQIRLIQNNDQTLAEKIQTSVLATIPIWKSQMVLALAINKQQQAAKLQKEVADTTNEMLRKNAERLEGATIDTAREVERSIVDIETLKEVQSRLINSIQETLSITQQARQKRAEVEKELGTMEQDLREKLTSFAGEQKELLLSPPPSR